MSEMDSLEPACQEAVRQELAMLATRRAYFGPTWGREVKRATAAAMAAHAGHGPACVRSAR